MPAKRKQPRTKPHGGLSWKQKQSYSKTQANIMKFRKRMLGKPKTKSLLTNNYSSKGPFKPVAMWKLPYTQSFTLTVGASGLIGTVQTMRLNSLFDPDFTGTGHQPYGYDALAVAYNRYKVVGVTVSLEFSDPTIDSMSCNWAFLNPSEVSTFTIASLHPDTAGEKQQTGRLALNNSGSQVAIRKAFIPMYKVSGVTKLQFNADPDNYTAAVGGSPASQCQLEIGVADLRGGSSGSVMLIVRLCYHVMFYQRKIMAQS